jgi:3-hydroxybutyryl-CoA dehydrogenase
MASIRNVAIVGAGTMGRRIAFQCARTGMPCRIYDVLPEALEGASPQIRGWLEEKLGTDGAADAMTRIEICDDLARCLDGVDLVIENVPENLEIKRAVFAELDRLAPAHTLLATNSSSLPASRMATATGRPDKVFNVNFGNPPEDELLVEMMAAEGVPSAVLEAGEDFLKAIGTVPIVTRKEIMGFSMNRVWRAIKKETLHLVGDGYSDFEDLDRAWRLVFGSRLGPFGIMDEIGLDVVRDIEQQYYEDSGEERDRPPDFLERMVAEGRLGVKTGRGFYSHPNPEYEVEGWLEKRSPWSPDKTVDLDV